MEANLRRTWAEISLDALEHNAKEIKKHLPKNCGVMAVVKANGYGHGAVAAAKAFISGGCTRFAVACPEEALELRQGGVWEPILILGAVDPEWAPEMAKYEIALAVESKEKGEALSAALEPGQKLKIHIKLDTGMSRIGFLASDDDALQESADVLSLPNLEAEGIFTHFAVSDTEGYENYTRGQFAIFSMAADAIEYLSGKRFAFRHCSNSGAVQFYREEGFCLDYVRPGLILYGITGDQRTGALQLTPAMTLKTRIVAISKHEVGDTVSYGRTWICERPTKLAVIPVGYADGLQRALSGKLEALVQGQRVPQVGRICMDACMIDVTDLPQVSIGDEVTVFGSGASGEMTALELAELAGTIPYEIICGISPRVPRIIL